MNSVNLVGNLTRDVELRYLESGAAVGNTGLAINEKYKDKSGKMVEKTVFVDVTMWGRTAEVASEYTHKGSKIGISGKLTYDSWEDKDGNKRSKVSVTADKIHLLDSKESGGNGRAARPAQSHEPEAEEIPF